MRSIRHAIIVAAIGFAIAADGPAAQGRREAELALRVAMETETVKGDLKSAIAQYRKISTGPDRELAVKALLRMAECYHKLGDPQAREIFAQIVRDYTDQADAAAAARARLAAMSTPPPNVPAPAQRLVMDWSRSNDMYAIPTRDGRTLLRYNGEQRAFELVDIAGGSVRQLFTDVPRSMVGKGHFHLSTDGRKLAAVVVRAGNPQNREELELRIFDVGGRGEGRLLARWAAADLSRFGVRIFGWGPKDERIWVWIMMGDSTAQIASVDLNGNVQTLKTLTWRDHSQPPSLSPDGQLLAYHDAIDRSARPDVYLLATDGSREQRLEHPANDSKPMFLPDGSGIVFESDRRGSRDLWFVPISTGRIAGAARLVWRNLSPFGQAERFAENGAFFYFFATNDWSTYTFTLDSDVGGARLGQSTRLPPALNEVNTVPAFSPDGKYLAHLRGSGRRIVFRELATGREREIPFDHAVSAYGAIDWCPSGNVLFASGYGPGVGDIAYRISMNDASVQRLPVNRQPLLCGGSGDEAIHVRIDGADRRPTGIVRRSIASGNETVLFEGHVSNLVRSRDGSQIAFVVHDMSRARLVTMPASGGTISNDLMTTPYFGEGGRKTPLLMAIAWMPDGQRLLVVRHDDDVAGRKDQVQYPLWVWEVPVKGGAARRIGELPLSKVDGYFAGIGSLTVHPDGTQLAYYSHEGYVEQTWAIDNLAQFIKATGAP